MPRFATSLFQDTHFVCAAVIAAYKKPIGYPVLSGVLTSSFGYPVLSGVLNLFCGHPILRGVPSVSCGYSILSGVLNLSCGYLVLSGIPNLSCEYPVLSGVLNLCKRPSGCLYTQALLMRHVMDFQTLFSFLSRV